MRWVLYEDKKGRIITGGQYWYRRANGKLAVRSREAEGFATREDAEAKRQSLDKPDDWGIMYAE
jgi:hypothetical protein